MNQCTAKIVNCCMDSLGCHLVHHTWNTKEKTFGFIRQRNLGSPHHRHFLKSKERAVHFQNVLAPWWIVQWKCDFPQTEKLPSLSPPTQYRVSVSMSERLHALETFFAWSHGMEPLTDRQYSKFSNLEGSRREYRARQFCHPSTTHSILEPRANDTNQRLILSTKNLLKIEQIDSIQIFLVLKFVSKISKATLVLVLSFLVFKSEHSVAWKVTLATQIRIPNSQIWTDSWGLKFEY